jgi:hypothetical protein
MADVLREQRRRNRALLERIERADGARPRPVRRVGRRWYEDKDLLIEPQSKRREVVNEMRQRVQLNRATDLWTAASTELGKMVTAPALERLVREELDRLTTARAGGGSARLLNDGEIDELRSRARANVLRRLRAEDTAVVADVDPLESIRAEFRTRDAEPDEAGLLVHARAEVILAAARKEMNESNYVAVLHVLDSEEARRADTSELAEHLRNAELLSNAAEEALRNRGTRKSDLNYEEQYLGEITTLARTYGLPL